MLLTLLLLCWVHRHGFMELGQRPFRGGGVRDVPWAEGARNTEEAPVLRPRQGVQDGDERDEAPWVYVQGGVLVQL